jgi:hypothetical protein
MCLVDEGIEYLLGELWRGPQSCTLRSIFRGSSGAETRANHDFYKHDAPLEQTAISMAGHACYV